METNLKKDLSTITTIDEIYIKKLFDKLIWCIDDAVINAIDNGDNYVSCDLGIGKIILIIDENSVKYKFIPSPELESSVNESIVTETNPFEVALEKNLVSKITNIYKELL